MKSIRLALDWTPNVNHIGFLVGLEKGYYSELGIDLEIIEPSVDNYATTPAKKVELGLADLALCPTESLISYQTKESPLDLVAIAAVLQNDLSAIAVLDSSDITRPADLDGKLYASYAARYEDGIVREMVKNDGGQGSVECIYPDKLGIWGALINGGADATWIFLNWEGVAAQTEGLSLRLFRLADFAIPYSYSPVVAGSRSFIECDREIYSAFLEASRRGHAAVKEDPALASDILTQYVADSDKGIDLLTAIEYTLPHFGLESRWGSIDRSIVQSFLIWLKDQGLESQNLTVDDLILEL